MWGDYSVGQVITVDGCDGAVEAIVLEISASGVFYDTLPVNDVYWSGADQAAALLDGWALFQVDGGKLEIQRHDESSRFDDDIQARDYVMNSGDGRCRRAKAYLLLFPNGREPMIP